MANDVANYVADDVLVMKPDDLFERNGVTWRYLGNGLAEPVEMLTKRFDTQDMRPIGASHAAQSGSV